MRRKEKNRNGKGKTIQTRSEETNLKFRGKLGNRLVRTAIFRGERGPNFRTMFAGCSFLFLFFSSSLLSSDDESTKFDLDRDKFFERGRKKEGSDEKTIEGGVDVDSNDYANERNRIFVSGRWSFNEAGTIAGRERKKKENVNGLH